MMNTDKLDRVALEEFNFCPEMGRDDTKGLTKQQLFDGVRRLVARLQQEAEPVAWVPCGDIDYSPEDTPPNWQRIETSKAQVAWLIGECKIRMRPVYLGCPPAQPAQSAEVPAGMALVPKRITDEMYDAWADDDGDIQTAWDAMLAAAPARPVGGEGEW